MITDIEIIFRLIIVLILSGLIGLERESYGREAGLRTHILVGMGATLIMLTSIYLASKHGVGNSADPGRVAAGVVTGIGFIGAGTIMRFRASVKGLTTAASLWASAGIGLAVGVGFYMPALVATALILFSLIFLGRVERIMITKRVYKTLRIITASGANELQQIRGILADYKAQIQDLDISKLEEPQTIDLKIDLKLASARHNQQIIQDVLKIDGVRQARWTQE
jgi:putative Mg2+ transporter-C (MgtC) family protein